MTAWKLSEANRSSKYLAQLRYRFKQYDKMSCISDGKPLAEGRSRVYCPACLNKHLARSKRWQATKKKS